MSDETVEEGLSRIREAALRSLKNVKGKELTVRVVSRVSVESVSKAVERKRPWWRWWG